MICRDFTHAVPLRFLFVILSLALCAVMRAVEPSLSLEKCYGPYRIQSYLAVAAALQALPKDERIDKLSEWAGPGYGFFNDTKEYPGEQVYMLCQMLFQPKEPGDSLAPQFRGRAQFVGEPISSNQSAEERERDPLFWVGDIPFNLVLGYAFAGSYTVTARGYLNFCIRNADWTTRDFVKVDIASLPAAYDQLLELHPWSRPLGKSEADFLANQIQPYRAPELQRPGIFVTMKRLNAQSITGKAVDGAPLVLAADEKISVMIGSGGTRPYRYTLTLANATQPEPRVVDEGTGRSGIEDPFRREMVEPKWPDYSEGDDLVFQLTDAAGAGHKLYFRVLAPDILQVTRQPLEAREHQ